MATKEQLHVGDYGTSFELTIRKAHNNSVLDVSKATLKTILFRWPDGTIDEHDATFVTDGKDGRIKYVTVDGDIDQAGLLEYRAMVTLPYAHYESSTQRITVHPRWMVMPTFVSSFAAAFEGDSIVASVPPAAGTTSFAWRFADEFTPSPQVNINAVSGTNMTNMQSRLPAFKAEIQAVLPTVDKLIVYAQMGNGLLEKQAAVLAADMVAYFDEIKALDPTKIITLASFILHRDNDDLAPGDWETEVNLHNSYIAQLYYRFDSIMRWQDLSATFAYSNALPMSFPSPTYPLGDGIHPNDTTNEEMTTLIVAEANELLSNIRPINFVAPVASGTTTQGSTVLCSTGTWNNLSTITYQWHRSSSPFPIPIPSATSSTYILTAADVGNTVFCVVTNTRSGIAVNKASNSIGPITGPTGDFSDLVFEDFTQTDTLGVHYSLHPASGTSSSPDATGNGPLGTFDEYNVHMDAETYLYRQAFEPDIPQDPTVGQTLHWKLAVKGTAGQKVGVRMSDFGAGEDEVLVTFDGSWQEVNISLPVTSLGSSSVIFGFERREGVIAGSSTGGNIDFKAWGSLFTKT